MLPNRSERLIDRVGRSLPVIERLRRLEQENKDLRAALADAANDLFEASGFAERFAEVDRRNRTFAISMRIAARRARERAHG